MKAFDGRTLFLSKSYWHLLMFFIEVSNVYTKFVEDREVVCSSDKMVVNLSFKQPFTGVVFIQNHYPKAECRWRGNGSHFLLIVIPLSESNSNSSDDSKKATIGYTEFCGVGTSKADKRIKSVVKKCSKELEGERSYGVSLWSCMSQGPFTFVEASEESNESDDEQAAVSFSLDETSTQVGTLQIKPKVKKEQIGDDVTTSAGWKCPNDAIIDSCLDLVVERSLTSPLLPTVFAFDTHFYTELEQKRMVNLTKWTKKLDIFAYGMLIVPFHQAGHWALVSNREVSTTLVISPDDTILTDDALALTVRCVQSGHDLVLTLGAPSLDPSFRILRTESMTVLGNSGTAPSLTLRLLDGHGIIGRNVSEAVVGQRLTLDAVLKDTSIYDVFVHDCIAHDGTHNPDATITIVDFNGCAIRLPRAVDAPVLMSSPQKNTAKHIYVHIYGFQFTSSEYVHFECQVSPCINACDQKQCDEGSAVVKSNPAPKLPAYLVKTVIQIIPQSRTQGSAEALFMDKTSLVADLKGQNNTTCTETVWTALTIVLVLLSIGVISYGVWKLLKLGRKALLDRGLLV